MDKDWNSFLKPNGILYDFKGVLKDKVNGRF